MMDFSSSDNSCDYDDDPSITSHMEKKYLCDQHVESFINIFGTSPCKVATERGLELLVLNRKNISRVGDEQWFASFVKNVSELDLAWNKIQSWGVISTLLSSLPSLKRLNLAHNPIKPVIDTNHLPTSHKLTTLVLNGVNLPLRTVKEFTCSGVMPVLNELHMSENQFKDLDEFGEEEEPISETVEVLHLNACGFRQWSAILELLQLFPNTQHLYLVDNHIQSVDRECPRRKLQTQKVCQHIRSLSLSQCRLNTWKAIDNLQWGLEELRIRNIPLLQAYTDEERHHLVVGRLRSLTQLNGSLITPFQREESERFFIRYYQGVEEKPEVFEELVKKHGNLEQLVKVDLTPRKFAKVMMRCEETNYLAPTKIRLNCSVLELMKYASKITGIPSTRMRLFYFDGNISGFGPTELRFPNQMLSSLHIEDGDEFFIQSKIVPTKQKNPS